MKSSRCHLHHIIFRYVFFSLNHGNKVQTLVYFDNNVSYTRMRIIFFTFLLISTEHIFF